MIVVGYGRVDRSQSTFRQMCWLDEHNIKPLQVRGELPK